MLTYLEYKDEKSAKFWQIELSGNTHTVTYGKIGTDGRSSTKTFDTTEAAKKDAEKLIASKTKKGYAIPGQEKDKKPAETSGIKSNFKETYKYFEIKDCTPEIKEMLEVVQGDCDAIIYFEEDVFLNENLDYSFIEQFCKTKKIEFNFIVVNGNLTVNGRIDLSEDFPGLIVSGFTKAETLEGGDCEIYIEDGAFDFFVYGHYNHGILETGNVKTQFVINSDHHLIVNSDNAIFIDEGNNGDDDYDYFGSDLEQNFIAKVFDEDGALDISEFYKLLKAGKKVLRKGAKTTKQRVLESIPKGDKVVHDLNLSDKKLTSFPKEVLKLTTLKKLDLSWNEIKVIPAEINKLTELEELNLHRCHLDELPIEIFHLTKLKKLILSYNNFKIPEELGNLKSLEHLDVSHHSKKIDEGEFTEFILPDSIGNLSNLKVLINNENIGDLPESITKLKNLEKFQLKSGSWIYVKKFPKYITEIKSLRILDLGNNPFESIPQSIVNLPNLEELNLSGSLGYIETVPNLSELTKLKVLWFNGASFGKTGAKLPKHKTLQKLFTMSLNNLEELQLDRWGPKLESAFFKGISKFKNLKKLDLSFCKLERLPEEILLLEKLESLFLDSNDLPETEYNKLSSLKNLVNLTIYELKKIPEAFYSLDKLEQIIIRYSTNEVFDEITDICLKNYFSNRTPIKPISITPVLETNSKEFFKTCTEYTESFIGLQERQHNYTEIIQYQDKILLNIDKYRNAYKSQIYSFGITFNNIEETTEFFENFKTSFANKIVDINELTRKYNPTKKLSTKNVTNFRKKELDLYKNGHLLTSLF